jgi:cytoskeletal protein RodZ
MKSVLKVAGWGAGLLLLFALIGNHTANKSTNSFVTEPSSSSSSAVESAADNAPVAAPQTAPAPQPASPTPSPTPELSNNSTYTNADGTTVHSPAYASDNSIPAGATARCSDGTYSFSQHRSGTCSHHGGVAKWL